MQLKTKQKFRELNTFSDILGTDGKYHAMDGTTKIPVSLCECLADLHKSVKPDLSLETGLAYGFSTLAILDVMYEYRYGRHISIDPTQIGHWNGVALIAIEQLGFADRFSYIEARSDDTLVQMIAQNKNIQYVFLDGSHLFDSVLTDVKLVDRILDIGGLLIINDLWLPSIRAAVSFIENNLKSFKRYKAIHENICVFRKTGHDNREWDHFVSFDGVGRIEKKARVFSKLFG